MMKLSIKLCTMAFLCVSINSLGKKSFLKGKLTEQELNEIDPDFQQFYNPNNTQEFRDKQMNDQLKGVSYVKQISNYAKDQLLEQKQKKNSFLIGKPVYFENQLLFDDTPSIYQAPVGHSFTDVNVPMSEMTQEKHELWNNRMHMSATLRDSAVDKSQFQDVYYKDQKGNIDKNKFNLFDQVQAQQSVGIVVNNNHSQQQNQQDQHYSQKDQANSKQQAQPELQQLKDRLIGDTINPIKFQQGDTKKETILKFEDKKATQLADTLDQDLDSIL